MFKYNPEDKFILEVESAIGNEHKLEAEPAYKMKGVEDIVFNESFLDSLEKLEEGDYDDGWAVAKQLICMNRKEIQKIFHDVIYSDDVYTDLDAIRNITRSISYKEIQNRIYEYNCNCNLVIGDVVEYMHQGDIIKGVVLSSVTPNGTVSCMFPKTFDRPIVLPVDSLRNSGIHINLCQVIEQPEDE